jgi:hypothetical protein
MRKLLLTDILYSLVLFLNSIKEDLSHGIGRKQLDIKINHAA